MALEMEKMSIKFSEIELMPQIMRAVEDMGFEEMTPIQERAIPIVVSGRDIVEAGTDRNR